jgi:hypothetical protein
VVIDDFEHTCAPSDPLERLDSGVFASGLSQVKRGAHYVANVRWESSEIVAS